MRRQLKGKGIEFIEDSHGIGTWYYNGVKMSQEQINKLTIDDVCRATTPQTEEEWEDYYEEKNALDRLDEMRGK